MLCLFPFFLHRWKTGREKEPVIAAGKDSAPANRTERPAANPYNGVDVSPMDMVYYPADYPKLKMAHTLETPPWPG